MMFGSFSHLMKNEVHLYNLYSLIKQMRYTRNMRVIQGVKDRSELK